MWRWGVILLGAWLLAGPPGHAHEFKFGEVAVATPWARATIGAGRTGVAFLTSTIAAPRPTASSPPRPRSLDGPRFTTTRSTQG